MSLTCCSGAKKLAKFSNKNSMIKSGIILKLLIVGVDPGLSTAVALVGLKGNFIAARSRKEFKKQEIIRFVFRYGKPVIVASDRKKPPSFTRKLAAALGCKLFSPENDLLVEEKNEFTKNLELAAHEKDAAASAINAYKNYATQFSKIDSSLSSQGLEKYGDSVKEMILFGRAKNIDEAVRKIKKKSLLSA